MPAASAICRVVTASPCSTMSGSAAATIIERRSSGGRAAARLDAWSGRSVAVMADEDSNE
jgi:hypothetical protein